MKKKTTAEAILELAAEVVRLRVRLDSLESLIHHRLQQPEPFRPLLPPQQPWLPAQPYVPPPPTPWPSFPQPIPPVWWNQQQGITGG